MTKKSLFNAFILCMALESISFVSCKEKEVNEFYTETKEVYATYVP